jgi:hypothetical protein
MELAKKANGLWRSWIEDNMALFAGLSSSAQIGFLAKDVFENQGGSALILRPNQAALPLIEEVGFTGFRKLPVDIIFVAPSAVLESLSSDNAPGKEGSFYKLIRKREIIFFTLASPPELEEKNYADFLESIGLGHIGTCAG